MLGITAIQTLPRIEDPTIQSRSASIVTLFPGAPADRVEALVTKPIEDAVRTLADVRTVESASRAGASVITIELQPMVDDIALTWTRVRDELANVVPTLPAGAGAPEVDDMGGYAYTVVAAVAWDAPGAPNDAILARAARCAVATVEAPRRRLAARRSGRSFKRRRRPPVAQGCARTQNTRTVLADTPATAPRGRHRGRLDRVSGR